MAIGPLHSTSGHVQRMEYIDVASFSAAVASPSVGTGFARTSQQQHRNLLSHPKSFRLRFSACTILMFAWQKIQAYSGVERILFADSSQ